MQPGTVEATCLGCGETFTPDLHTDEIVGTYIGTMDPLDWGTLRYVHTTKESGQECNELGKLTPQTLARLRHPANRGKL